MPEADGNKKVAKEANTILSVNSASKIRKTNLKTAFSSHLKNFIMKIFLRSQPRWAL